LWTLLYTEFSDRLIFSLHNVGLVICFPEFICLVNLITKPISDGA
jgi:hypothetical protein